MAFRSADRSYGRGFAFLRSHRLTIVAAAAPLAVLLAATVTMAAPLNGAPAPPDSAMAPAEQDTVPEDPNFRRVAVTGPGATFDITGQPEPLGTGPFAAGEVDLAKHDGDVAVTTANLVIGTVDDQGPFGEVDVSIRPDIPADVQYDPSSQSLIFNPGVEFEAERVPGMVSSDPIFLYVNPIRLLATEPVDDPQFPPYDRTFRLPSPVLLWEGADGVTGSESIGMLTALEFTITHPA